jgi:hypothetical protein
MMTAYSPVELDVHAYAVVIGGPDGKHLFVCASTGHDPAEIAANASARILLVELAG